MSNVLEHLEHRIEFLRHIRKRNKPSKYLIRVPVFERDWRVPLMKELNLDYRLDVTYHIEYTQEEFFRELRDASLRVETYKVCWGEIWAIVRNLKESELGIEN